LAAVASPEPVSVEFSHPVLTRLRTSNAAPLLSVRQVAARLGVCTATVYALCGRAELPHVRIRNVIRVLPADLEAFLRARRKGSDRGGR
jgi:excisionase family DNA binding protein